MVGACWVLGCDDPTNPKNAGGRERDECLAFLNSVWRRLASCGTSYASVRPSLPRQGQADTSSRSLPCAVGVVCVEMP